MSETNQNKKLRVSSKGKRLYGLLFDFIFALLAINTVKEVTKEEHWDLASSSGWLSIPSNSFEAWMQVLPFYAGILLLMLIKDMFGGASIGKYLLGMNIRLLKDLKSKPSVGTTILRNLSLVLLPIDGILTLFDPYARRLADRWLGTVVVDNPKATRPVRRLLLANIIFLGFFFTVFLLQPYLQRKTAAYQIATTAIQNYEPLYQHVGRIQSFEEPEMYLDLRENGEPSIFQVLVKDGRKEAKVHVKLNFLTEPKTTWIVSEIKIVLEPSEEEIQQTTPQESTDLTISSQ